MSDIHGKTLLSYTEIYSLHKDQNSVLADSTHSTKVGKKAVCGNN